MTKSEIYFLAQMAVLPSCELKDTDKLLILRELMVQEELWKGCEENTEKEKAE